MITIHKFPLEGAKVEVRLPADAEVLTVQTQIRSNSNGYTEVPFVWVKLDTSTESEWEIRRFVLFATGEEIPADIDSRVLYIGTFQQRTETMGTLVWHLFEIV
jgi:hypothetical protein